MRQTQLERQETEHQKFACTQSLPFSTKIREAVVEIGERTPTLKQVFAPRHGCCPLLFINTRPASRGFRPSLPTPGPQLILAAFALGARHWRPQHRLPPTRRCRRQSSRKWPLKGSSSSSSDTDASRRTANNSASGSEFRPKTSPLLSTNGISGERPQRRSSHQAGVFPHRYHGKRGGR